jgi:hypothetical protein
MAGLGGIKGMNGEKEGSDDPNSAGRNKYR